VRKLIDDKTSQIDNVSTSIENETKQVGTSSRQIEDVNKQTKIATKQIAFFDFDGTITTRDTLLEFIKFCKGKSAFYFGFTLNLHYLIAYKIGIISNQAAKERILTYFFRNTTLATFESYCSQFSTSVLPGLIRAGAKEEILKLINNGVEVVIVTASAEDWVRPWTESLGIELIGTRLELIEQKLTGKIQDINCHGEEKVKRIKESYSLDNYEKIVAYGDTKGDKAMMALAHTSYYKPFR
jgi:phosphatidylglycerophosphatase C